MGTFDFDIARLESRVGLLESEAELGIHAIGSPIPGAQWLYFNAINSVRSDDERTVHRGDGQVKTNSAFVVWRVLLHLQSKCLSINAFLGQWNVPESGDPAVPLLTLTMLVNTLFTFTMDASIRVRPVIEDWDPDLVADNNRPTDFGTPITQVADLVQDGSSLTALGSSAVLTQRAPIMSIARSDFLAVWGLHATQYRLTQAQIDSGIRIHGIQVEVVATPLSDDEPVWEAIGTLDTNLLDSDKQPVHAAILF